VKNSEKSMKVRKNEESGGKEKLKTDGKDRPIIQVSEN
jgi:hypothetical protein